MENNAQKDGRMTPEIADALKAYVRRETEIPGTPIGKEIADLNGKERKHTTKVEDVAGLNGKLIHEVKQDHPSNKKIKELVSEGAEIDAKDSNDDLAPLMYAACKDRKSTVDTLLGLGADVDVKTNGGKTALMYASWYNHEEIFEILMNAHANLDTQDNEGRTALMRAAARGCEWIVKELMLNGADPDLADNEGRTALMRASLEGKADVVSAMVCAPGQKHANVNLKDNEGWTAMDYAKNKEIKKLLKNAAK